jgi:BTB/POZ domain
MGSNPRNKSLDLGSFYDHSSCDQPTGVLDPNTPDPISWRQDPKVSLSDWKVVITTTTTTSATFSLLDGTATIEEGTLDNETDDNATATTAIAEYNIHKLIVGAGSRGSQYFLRLFQANQTMTEAQSRTSKIELESSAAVAFPAMLDFIYGPYSSSLGNGIISGEVVASTHTAVALRYLAQYFGVPTLFDSVNQFIQKDMNKDTIHIYLQEAIIYLDDKIIDSTMKVASWTWPVLLVEESCRAYMELLPLSKHLQWTKMILQEADSLLKTTQEKLAKFHPLGFDAPLYVNGNGERLTSGNRQVFYRND